MTMMSDEIEFKPEDINFRQQLFMLMRACNLAKIENNPSIYKSSVKALELNLAQMFDDIYKDARRALVKDLKDSRWTRKDIIKHMKKHGLDEMRSNCNNPELKHRNSITRQMIQKNASLEASFDENNHALLMGLCQRKGLLLDTEVERHI